MFYPEDEPVSVGLVGQEMVLEPLSTRHVELDYEAVMESKELLRRWSLSDWPSDEFSIEENAADLTRHESEHFDRVAFTYTVLNPDGTECLGCVYIKPFGDKLRTALSATDKSFATLEHVAWATFWVRQSRLAENLDRVLLEKLIYWFNEEFSFDKLLFSTAENDDRQVSLFQEAGLKQLHRSELADGRGARLFFV
jgi:hypothetical protein